MRLELNTTGDVARLRLPAHTDDGQAVTVSVPWPVWRAVTTHAEKTLGPTLERAPWIAEIALGMTQHAARWGLGPRHHDGTCAEDWAEDAQMTRDEATKAALEGELTWAHTVMAGFYAVLATEEPAELRAALAVLAGGAANWITAMDARDTNAPA
ncbi:hypothetical protein [Nonomuraea soli]|uniref:Uncharacterized protein n=1 Tax=Nonomuraea soli TaxID=1032476 RepID=A0A7W0CUG3_9ACTN|nr:hypothetical protein [Nonomuraea soli]MBA2897374.1 hypothetical protein [Nonomuraea soli]